MTQIMIDVKPETAQHIHAMLGAQVAYRLEVERMKPAAVRPIVFEDFPSGAGY